MTQIYVPRFLSFPKDHAWILGPRGTGKSMWLRHVCPEAIRIDLLHPEEYRRYSARPELLRELCRDQPPGTVCILDEIQEAMELLTVVHSLIEEETTVQFILTGSSMRKLRRSGGNLLGGRALLRKMPPFWAAELKENFDLRKAIQTGLIPLIWEAKAPSEKLQAYIKGYLKEEVMAEGLVRQIGDFHRFLEVISFSHGQLLNTTAIAREAQVKRQTVDNYLGVLEDLLLAFVLPVFTRRAQRALAAHPKFYFFDIGLASALRPRGFLDSVSEMEGALLEGLVAQHLRSWVDAQDTAHQLAFWRTREKLEVDFIVYGSRGFWAIEVKRGSEPGPDDVRSLVAFQREYPEATCILLHSGSHPMRYRGFDCLPVETFLQEMHPERVLTTPKQFAKEPASSDFLQNKSK